MNPQDFQELLHRKEQELYRSMPWREDTRPYYVLVSELMLQQTQVDRVIPKFEAFIQRFPNEKELAQSSLADVLKLWDGLGYNRRAKYLHEAAKKIVNEWGGVFPHVYEELVRLPGVGPGTAGALLAYAYNQPVVFIETNVRTVYFHHFFEMGDKVTDAELLPIIEATLDKEHPRTFYWAVMDYGTWLKKQGVGRITQSQHYKKQPPLKGSVREIRGQILHLLMGRDISVTELRSLLPTDERFDKAIAGLQQDGLIQELKGIVHLSGEKPKQ